MYSESLESTGPANGREQKVVVIGLGMVGLSFIEQLLSRDEDELYTIIVVGEEPHLAYNRVGLTQYLSNRSVDSLLLNPSEWYQSHKSGRLSLHLGDKALAVDTTAKLVRTTKTEIPYDTCIIATGSDAALPSYVSRTRLSNTNGCFVYRNIADLDGMITYAGRHSIRTAVVVGGGLLGLEAAKAILDLHEVSKVILVERNEWILSRQLDGDAGRMVLEKVRDLGIEVLLKTRSEELLVRTQEDGHEVLTGLRLDNGGQLECQMVVFAIGIRPRDDLAKASCIGVHLDGGVVVGDDLSTNAADVFAIGECANWRGKTYGLIGPGIEMADILSFNMTEGPKHKMRKLSTVDMSTKLKLLGVEVASFGDYLADKNGISSFPARGHKKATEKEERKQNAVKSLTYHDPFAAVYKKYLFTEDGKHLLGGMMVGDVKDYSRLLSIVKAAKALDVPPGQLILGIPRKENEEDGADLESSAQVCSCHNKSKRVIVDAVKSGCSSFGELKAKTKIGTGCGGCVPLATSVFNTEMRRAGHTVSNHLCIHFKYTRVDLFNIVKIKNLKTFQDVMKTCGSRPDAIGCEICKPTLASILSSAHNELILDPVHHQNQDTNDRYLANIQRNGTYSVVPRVSGGEITPAKLRRIGEVAEEFGLYTKITGGQRIDMFGAQKKDLPDIWEKLIDAGFETGQAYGKALRTVKSCVGTTWCRYGIGDSVKMAIELESRYKGIRSPHKIKGGVSGCVRECAEAQSKDFGLIATDKGWNVFVAGNGGAKPKHATLLAQDVPKAKAIRIVDRYLMFYIRTADKLTRTARWIENMDGGVDYLKKVILNDELGICEQLEKDMDALVGTYYDEWAAVVKDPERRKRFQQFANTNETVESVKKIQERGQERPADWPKSFGSLKLQRQDIAIEESTWQWRKICRMSDLRPSNSGCTSAAVKYGDTQLAVFHVPGKGFFASQNMCPHKRAFVLSDGVVGDGSNGEVYVSCPLHKRNYSIQSDLSGGRCLNDNDYSIATFEIKDENGDIYMKLPDTKALDFHLGTSNFMVARVEAVAAEVSASAGAVEGKAFASSRLNAQHVSCGSHLEW